MTRPTARRSRAQLWPIILASLVAGLLSCASATGASAPAARAAVAPAACSEQLEIDLAVTLIDPHGRVEWRFRPASQMEGNNWGLAGGSVANPEVWISNAVPCRNLAATIVHEGTHVLQARAVADPAAVYGARGVEEIADLAPILLGVSDGYSPALCAAARLPVVCSAPPVPPRWVAAVNELLLYR